MNESPQVLFKDIIDYAAISDSFLRFTLLVF